MSNKPTCAITVMYDQKQETIACEKGSTLLDVLSTNHKMNIETPCGGKGTCGKCKVRIIGDNADEPGENEKKKLTQKESEQGYRLACRYKVLGDIKVLLKNTINHIQILEGGVEFDIKIDPLVKKTVSYLEKPTLEDQKDDLKRLKLGLKQPPLTASLETLQQLPALLRENNFTVTTIHNDKAVLRIEGGDTSEKNYGVAADIGTTTVVAYLMNLNTGKRLGVASGLNAQRSYGQDVISRIHHTLLKETGLKELQASIISQLNGLIENLLRKTHIERENLYTVVLAGNTTMMHLAAGLPPGNIAAAPFIPVTTERMVIPASELGLAIAQDGLVYMLPGVAGYVGADIVAATLSSGMAFKDELSLLIDIGTNGEIVLGNKHGLLCCSTAAGPAFEGAQIRNGVGGIEGAINTVFFNNASLHYTTIGESAPIGICGSGIIDILSILVSTGIVDDTGRMLKPNEIQNESGQLLAGRMVRLDDEQNAIILADGQATETGDPIYLTQKDVREVQLAKASIAAGISTLVKKAGKSIEDIQIVYIAGGFGSYIDKKHALNIGLIPRALDGKIKVIGNAAGSGAVMSLLSNDSLEKCDRIVTKSHYVELSSSLEFQNEYVNCMLFH
ncbi:MAG: ASKHA domain-containing protein [Spirochaetota bacterium]